MDFEGLLFFVCFVLFCFCKKKRLLEVWKKSGGWLIG